MAVEIGRWKGVDNVNALVRRFISDELNPLVNGSMVDLHTPIPGYIVGSMTSVPIWSATVGGTYTTASTLKCGNNAAHDNVFAAFASPATTSFTAGVIRARATALGLNRVATEMLDLDAPIVCEITANTGVGSGTIRFRLLTSMLIVPISAFP